MASDSTKPTDALVLVPTRAEADELERLAPSARFEVCGFGPVAAAAVSARLLATGGPRRVLLVGIAGTYDERRLPIGSATHFERVALDGVGAGSGAERRTARELGFPQWRSDDGSDEVCSELPLATLGATPCAPRLLTVCACSDSSAMADERARRFEAQAEDMEAFGVALACRLADVPLAVVRGVSNVAGDRDVRGWSITQALESAWSVAERMLASSAVWRQS